MVCCSYCLVPEWSRKEDVNVCSREVQCIEALLRHCIGEKWRERCHHACWIGLLSSCKRELREEGRSRSAVRVSDMEELEVESGTAIEGE